MPARWTVLASGSSGNASLLELDGAGLLMDIGLGPRQLDRRLSSAGFGWDGVRGAILTHTHADHWSARSLARLAELRIPFFCHAEHIRPLRLACEEFQSLEWAGLVKTYDSGTAFSPLAGVRCSALPLKHDGGATFGFRIESDESSGSPHWAIGYAADLGSWDDALPHGLAEVDVLALEFNHDVERQLASGRSRWLINRVLGDFGHLSNEQGAKLLEECAGRSSPGRLRHVVQLHLSRDCNCPTLAEAAAREVIARLKLDVVLHTARQDASCPTIVIADHLADKVISIGPRSAAEGPANNLSRRAAVSCLVERVKASAGGMFAGFLISRRADESESRAEELGTDK